MSSLSRSMASFKIHQDDENVLQISNKVKEPSNGHKRAVLGVINTNSENEIVKNPKAIAESQLPLQLLKEPLLKLKPSLDCKNKKPLEKNENIAKNSTNNTNFLVRTPLRELVSKTCGNKSHTIKRYGSPMCVDRSPSPSTSIKSQLDELYSCSTYRADIFKYLKQLEVQFRPKAYYMKRQPDVTYSMRTILVDWLVEVSEEYKLHNETLYMAVSFIDRFLSSMAVLRAKLQLLGTAAMFIAAKFEEIYPPEVTEFTYITDDTYSKKQVLRMEHLILRVLTFDLSGPTIYTFLNLTANATNLDEKVTALAMYICELTLLEADPYLDFCPSFVAAGAIALARHCHGLVEIWPIVMVTTTGYNLNQLAPVITHLNETHQHSFNLPHAAIRDKYKSAKYHAASTIPFKKLIIRD